MTARIEIEPGGGGGPAHGAPPSPSPPMTDCRGATTGPATPCAAFSTTAPQRGSETEALTAPGNGAEPGAGCRLGGQQGAAASYTFGAVAPVPVGAPLAEAIAHLCRAADELEQARVALRWEGDRELADMLGGACEAVADSLTHVVVRTSIERWRKG